MSERELKGRKSAAYYMTFPGISAEDVRQRMKEIEMSDNEYERWNKELDNPEFASEGGGDLYCFFCGEWFVDSYTAQIPNEHYSDCIWAKGQQDE